MFVPVAQPTTSALAATRSFRHHLSRVMLACAVVWMALVVPRVAIAQAPPEANSSTGEPWVGSSAQAGSAAGAQTMTTGTVSTSPATLPGLTTPATAPAQPAPARVTTSSAPTQPASAGAPRGNPTSPRQQQEAEAADADPEALTMFRSELDPYGTWVDDPKYGRVWVPGRSVVGDGFSPYVTSGHWSLDSDDNWNWVSDHPFGWVVFHYGRWFYSTELGWAWVPGRVYAPNWVLWRLPTANYAYVGWAPMPPRFGWFGTGPVWYSSYGSVSYVFCPSDYLFYPRVGMYIVSDPWMVSRLGIYTSFYYPPYYGYYGYYGAYYGYGYGYGHSHGGYPSRYGAADRGYRSPGYGPPMNRTRISPRAVPRERIAADPRAVAVAPRRTSGSAPGAQGFGTFQRSPFTGAAEGRAQSRSRLDGRRSTSLGTTAPGYTRRGGEDGSPRTYSAPSRSYSAPSRTYSAPSRSYSAPSRTYSAPSRSYSAPSRTYSAPSRSYSAPSYSPPSRSYSAPSFRSSPSFSPSRGSSFGSGGGGRHRR